MVSNNDILRIASEMQKRVTDGADPGEVRNTFLDLEPEFAERYPGLFYKCSQPGTDMSILRFMLSSLEKGDKTAVPTMLDKTFRQN